VENAPRAPSLFFQLAITREYFNLSKGDTIMPRKKKREEHREHMNMELNCLKQFIADDRPITSIAYCTAFRLRMAIGGSRYCSEVACRRNAICARPVLECVHLEKASQFDWDYGWFNCQRKEAYGVDNDAWMTHIMGGTPEFMDAQKQTYRDEYMAFGEKQKAKAAR
jgi:hypothetical protein